MVFIQIILAVVFYVGVTALWLYFLLVVTYSLLTLSINYDLLLITEWNVVIRFLFMCVACLLTPFTMVMLSGFNYGVDDKTIVGVE